MTCSCLQQTENQRQHRVYFTRSVNQKHNKRGYTDRAFLHHTGLGNGFMQSNLSTTQMPNLKGTPKSHLHTPQKKPVTWCSTSSPVPQREATCIIQDNKNQMGALFNMKASYLNPAPEELGSTLGFCCLFNACSLSPDSPNWRGNQNTVCQHTIKGIALVLTWQHSALLQIECPG